VKETKHKKTPMLYKIRPKINHEVSTMIFKKHGVKIIKSDENSYIQYAIFCLPIIRGI
jgi:formaldehyde-activating enzyme involved in methanogenesis